MGYVALYREWRPKTFGEIVGQEHISRTLQNAIKTNRIAHAYLFCGPRGTGKTTSAKVLAKALNCLEPVGAEPCNHCENCNRVNDGSSMDVLEIDAASNRGIDEIRDLREKVKFAPTEGKYRVYIIDEVHMLTTEAFNALLKTLEEPPAHVVFVLATTEPHKIPMTVLSRCQRFDFKSIGNTDIIDRLERVIEELHIEADQEALSLIARAAEGGMRDALSILDQSISFGGKKVTLEDVNSVLGTVNIDFLHRMTKSVSSYNVQEALEIVDELVAQGKDVRQFARDMTYYLRNLILVQVCHNPKEIIQATDEQIAFMKGTADELNRERIISLIELFNSAEKEIKWASQPRLVLEIAVIRASERSAQTDLSSLLERIAELEQTVARITQGSLVVSKEIKPQPQVKEEPKSIENRPLHKPTDKLTTKSTGIEESKQLPENAFVTSETSTYTDIDTIKNCWQEILQRIKKVRMSARAFLVEGKPERVNDNYLLLAFPEEYAFHKEKVEQPENKNAIEQVIRDVIGKDIRIMCKFNNEIEKQDSTPTKDGLVDEAKKWFGGDVLEIED